MIYLNDHAERTSTQVQLHQIAEIAGIGEVDFQEQYNGDWRILNQDLYDFDFSDEPKYE